MTKSSKPQWMTRNENAERTAKWIASAKAEQQRQELLAANRKAAVEMLYGK